MRFDPSIPMIGRDVVDDVPRRRKSLNTNQKQLAADPRDELF
jgi:hypothetical protein